LQRGQSLIESHSLYAFLLLDATSNLGFTIPLLQSIAIRFRLVRLIWIASTQSDISDTDSHMAPSNWRRGGERRDVCRFFQRGQCRNGNGCRFSHIGSHDDNKPPVRSPTLKMENLDVENQAKADYMHWKRIVRSPPMGSDVDMMDDLWSSALSILNHGDKNSKQRLPQDLVDDEGTCGLEHVREVLTMDVHTLRLANLTNLIGTFLIVITHRALLDCLSVDSYVGDLYSFISGSGGTRAIPFFQQVCTSLIKEPSSASTAAGAFEDLVLSLATALRETLRRNARALFNDQLPDLIELLQNVLHTAKLDSGSAAYSMASRRLDDVRRLSDRSKSLLTREGTGGDGGGSKPVATSTYPRDIDLPDGRHDNDKRDITELKIIPSEGEMRYEGAEYLPSTSLANPHFQGGVEGLLDTQFRLLRHGMFGEIKNALGGLLRACDESLDFKKSAALCLTDLRAYHYHDIHVSYVLFDRRRGMEFSLSFPQPSHMQRKSGSERQRWWEETKRLEEGSLLSLLFFEDGKCSTIFLTVAQKKASAREPHSLASGDFACITARLAFGKDQDQLKQLLRLSLEHKNSQGNLLVEFPGVLPATFVPILENLQQMQESSDLPFYKWIVSDCIIDRDMTDASPFKVPPPLYARSQAFHFDLEPILTDIDEPLILTPTNTEDTEMTQRLAERTSLDRGQCEALIAALTREFALIQGPPGTGKSYLGIQLMRVLLHNCQRAALGPVLVVLVGLRWYSPSKLTSITRCYTNHALDQFLEHLMEIGIQKIIRIGGQSKSTLLEGQNLRLVSQEEVRTGDERYRLGRSIGETEDHEKLIRSRLGALHRGNPDWKSFGPYLAKSFPRVYPQFSRFDKDGFELAGRTHPFDLWTAGKGKAVAKHENSAGDMNQILWKANLNVFDLSMVDRETLLSYWAGHRIDCLVKDVCDLKQEYDESRQTSTDIYDEFDRRALETAEVIGVTTTGLAKRISVLRHVSVKVVICEEAGEVLEAHMLSALIPSAQHLIQIGDH